MLTDLIVIAALVLVLYLIYRYTGGGHIGGPRCK